MSDFKHCDFFVLRTPLLSFDEILAWSDAPDRIKHLREIVTRPEVRDAIFVGSPDLEASVDLWLREPDTERGKRIEQALVRYFVRMAGRPTPFGLFAGCSTGLIEKETRLNFEDQSPCRRFSRLDMDYLSTLTETLSKDPELRKSLTYYPNTSLYRAAGRIRYVESRVEKKVRSHHLVAVEENEYLQTTLQRAALGATAAALADALQSEEISAEEAAEFITELIDNQILVPDLGFTLTGPDPIEALVEQLRSHRCSAVIAQTLHTVRDELRSMDADGIGADPARYRRIAKQLETLPGEKPELPKLFQVDMIKHLPDVALGEPIIEEILRSVEISQKIGQRYLEDDLDRFRNAFLERYESKEVPLVEALDEETGIGFPVNQSGSDAAPLLRGLDFPGTIPESKWTPRETYVLRKLQDAIAMGAQEIILDRKDIEALADKDPHPLPDAFEVIAVLSAHSQEALNRGDFHIALRSIDGPSGARFLGRFCHADPLLQSKVEQHLRAEEALTQDAILAEIIHLPDGRLGNILFRPAMREYEIPYLGRSSVSQEKQIPVTDLNISVIHNEIVLRSARLGRRIIPRLTSAHNFSLRAIGTYRFLCQLQFQKTYAHSWSWGPLSNADFLPRVRFGRIILSVARWRLSKEEIRSLIEMGFSAIIEWRSDHKAPRFVALAEADNLLPVDLENEHSVQSFLHVIRKRDEAMLVEMFPPPESLCVRGPEGRFVHEIAVPFVRKSPIPYGGRASLPAIPVVGTDRTFPPGSEWLYTKLYTGTATADHVLSESVAPLAQNLLESGTADRWFFIRYTDPDHHLRVRFHGDPQRLQNEALPAIHEAVHPLLKDGQIRRIQFDTYEREIERYGGSEGILIAEQIFQIDSEAVLEILDLLEGDEGTDTRWRITLCGIHALLNDLGLELQQKHAVMKSVREQFGKELQADQNLKKQLAERFRKERAQLQSLLSGNPETEATEILQQRSKLLAPLIAQLKQTQNSIEDLASSFIHMHVNRMLRDAQRQHELVLYDFLLQLYASQIEREKCG